MFGQGLGNFYPYSNFGGGFGNMASGAAAGRGLFSGIRTAAGKIGWASILNNTQKTLNIVNQAIPIFYQVKPIWNNTKTIFKIMGAIKEEDKDGTNVSTTQPNTDTNHSDNTSHNTTPNYSISNDNQPNFFL